MKDVTLGGLSIAALGWVRENVEFPPPVPDTNMIAVPGNPVPLRISTGRISYKPREFSIALSRMCRDRAAFMEKEREIAQKISGQLLKVILSETPAYYYVGTITVSSKYDPITGRAELTLSSTDGDVYAYRAKETSVTFSDGGQKMLMNEFMPVVPKIVTTAETTIQWEIDGTQVKKTLSKGTWTLPELELREGSNAITITTTGAVTFIYREGRL